MKFNSEDMTNVISNETAVLHEAVYLRNGNVHNLIKERKVFNKYNDLLITSHRNLTCVSWLWELSQKIGYLTESDKSVNNNPYHESDKTINPTLSTNLTPVGKDVQTSELNPNYLGTHDLFSKNEFKVLS